MVVLQILIWYMIINIAISIYVTFAAGKKVDNAVSIVCKDEDIKTALTSSKLVKLQIYFLVFLYSAFCPAVIFLHQTIKEVSYNFARKKIRGDLNISFTWDPQMATVTTIITVNGEQMKYEDLNKAERKLYKSNAEHFILDLEMSDPDKTKVTMADIDRVKLQLGVD